jgi:hypothetical protein
MKLIFTLSGGLVFTIATLLMFLSCKKSEEKSSQDYFMTAEINGMVWTAPDGWAFANLDYNYTTEHHDISVRSQNNPYMSNGTSYNVCFSVHCPPVTGKYQFNNAGSVVNSTNGSIGYVYGYMDFGIDDYYLVHSINGFVEITNLTKSDIRGNFEFDAAGYDSNVTSDTMHIMKGSFFVPITGVSGYPWNGPK